LRRRGTRRSFRFVPSSRARRSRSRGPWPLSRAVIRWLDRKRTDDRQTTQLQQRLDDRFATLERNIDTVAVEVERLAEGQRFTTKLLAERDPRVAVNATP